jgi:hypothetical protein
MRRPANTPLHVTALLDVLLSVVRQARSGREGHGELVHKSG